MRPAHDQPRDHGVALGDELLREQPARPERLELPAEPLERRARPVLLAEDHLVVIDDVGGHVPGPVLDPPLGHGPKEVRYNLLVPVHRALLNLT
jgi:hypothetical protein